MHPPFDPLRGVISRVGSNLGEKNVQTDQNGLVRVEHFLLTKWSKPKRNQPKYQQVGLVQEVVYLFVTSKNYSKAK